MDLFLIVLIAIVGGYIGGLIWTHLSRILVVALVLGMSSTASAWTGYWHNPNPQPRQIHHHHCPPPVYNPYQYYSPYTYRAPRPYVPYTQPRPQQQLQIETPRRSWWFSW